MQPHIFFSNDLKNRQIMHLTRASQPRTSG